MLAAADHVRTIDENGDRKDGYLDCGIETVNGADVLIAFWDGAPARGKGGTADVVEYAQSIGKPIMIIDADSHEVRKENWERLEPDDAVLADLNGLAEAGSAGSVNPFKAPDAIFLFQQKCDYHASQGAPQFRRLIVATVVAHVMASVIGAAVVGYGLHLLALPWLELDVHQPSPWGRPWCCAARCTRTTAGCAAGWPRNSAAPRSPPGACRGPRRFCRTSTSSGARGLTRALYVLHSRSSATRPVPIEEFKRIYLAKRIDDQLAYYDRQVNRALAALPAAHGGFWIATAARARAGDLLRGRPHAARPTCPRGSRERPTFSCRLRCRRWRRRPISIISINDLQRRVARYRTCARCCSDQPRQGRLLPDLEQPRARRAPDRARAAAGSDRMAFDQELRRVTLKRK